MLTDALLPDTDTRPIAEMPFGDGAADREATAAWVRQTLARCGVTIAHEIESLGCTGAAVKGLTIDEIQKLRLGLGGGGVGLPCFVPPTRFCLAHNTIGGLQEQQKQLYPETAEALSRPLAPSERGHVEMVEASRRVRGSSLDDRLMKTADALRGRDLPPGVEAFDGVEENQPDKTVSLALSAAPPFTCSEHRQTNWRCRYCLAQAVVEGALEPVFAVASAPPNDAPFLLSSIELESLIEKLDKGGADNVDIYVLVAHMERKLTRTR